MKQELTIQQIIEDQHKLNIFAFIYSLKLLLSKTVLNINIEKLVFDIPLSNYSRKTFAHLRKLKKYKSYPDSLLKLSLFMKLYHNELFVDLNTLDIEYIKNFVSEKIKTKEIVIPWIYDRLLYDKYFDEFPDQKDTLEYSDTIKLLENTPQGVFQINKCLVGPFGLLESSVDRTLIPTLKFRLWHCSNPSCEAFHVTELKNEHNSDIKAIIQSIGDFNKNHNIEGFNKLYEFIARNRENYYNDKAVDNIIEFILYCFVENELRILLKNLLDEINIRNLFPDNPLFKNSAENIVKKLNKSECSQLILLYSDEQIIKHLEKLIYEKEINIPPTEIRKHKNQRHKGFYSTYPECNKLGIRIISDRSEIAIVRLKFLLKEIYNEPGLSSLLEWKLKNYTDNYSLDEKLENFIMNEDPRRIIQETIMSGPVQLTKTFEILGGYFIIPNDKNQENEIVDKILWKLGFDVNIYPNTLSKFYEYLRRFTDSVNKSVTYNENDRDEIRSSAVNLFVSLEEILQITLSYITWVLLSDHYSVTKFEFIYEEAREFMADQLHNYEFTPGEFLQIDKKGKNTLFPLVEGFNSLIAKCDSIIKNGQAKYQKATSELPHFYQDDKLKQFPFLSNKLVVDLRPTDYQNIKLILLSIAKEFGKTDVLQIRNRLQHNRDLFPSQTELLLASDSIGNIISKLDNTNLFPNVFLFKEKIIDKYKRSRILFENYKGTNITVIPTPEFSGMYLPDFNSPQLILPIIKLGLTSNFLRIKYKERSYYQQFWKSYPRKKTAIFNNIVSKEKIEKTISGVLPSTTQSIDI